MMGLAGRRCVACCEYGPGVDAVVYVLVGIS